MLYRVVPFHAYRVVPYRVVPSRAESCRVVTRRGGGCGGSGPTKSEKKNKKKGEGGGCQAKNKKMKI